MQQGKNGRICKNFVTKSYFAEWTLYTSKATMTETSGHELIYQ